MKVEPDGKILLVKTNIPYTEQINVTKFNRGQTPRFFLASCPPHSFGLLLIVLRLFTSRYFFRNRMAFGVTFKPKKPVSW